MEYNFKSRLTNKSFSEMIQLKLNIEKGLCCAVATLNPEKTKHEFENITRSKLNLKIKKWTNNVYDSSLL